MQTNALERARSPYLQRHRDNPVWWQEWTEDVLAVARDQSIPLFVSVGYATCHWCHVMAREAFSDPDVADILNRDFISIKVDREERPDIDQYLMTFLIASQGSGGWPLNAFLTPEGNPFLALTYIPVQQRRRMPGFSNICTQVLTFLEERGSDIPRFDLTTISGGTATDGTVGCEGIGELVGTIAGSYDTHHGGLGEQAKFPPYNTLLFLFHAVAICDNRRAREIAETTLSAMADRGLHDHVGGGFFRYCTDRSWSIPHFEKMLYDQAMALWVYAEAYATLKNLRYRQVAESIYECLERDFSDGNGCYISAHDAETHGQEGRTYLWTDEELHRFDSEFHAEWTRDFFDFGEASRFERFRHLLRRRDGPLGKTDQSRLRRMLEYRARRPQPNRDEKVVTAWNALAATSLAIAARRLEREDMRDRAIRIYRALADRNQRDDGNWCRSSLGGDRDAGRFLEDEAAVLLLLTYLVEDETDPELADLLREELRAAARRVESFRDDSGWTSARMRDFPEIPADRFDSPSPSPVSLAELALQRTALLEQRSGRTIERGRAIEQDFYNIAWLVAIGEYYLVESPAPHPWSETPINLIQARAPKTTWCFRGVCRRGLPESWNPL